MSNRHRLYLRLTPVFGALVVLVLAVSFALPTSSVRAAAPASNASGMWVVAFNQPSGLPSDVDSMVTNAGGTIVARLPEIGGISVQSSNPNFAAAMAANTQVKAADAATETRLIDPGADNASDNGGTYSPTGPDCATCMPDSLGFEQWDKKKMNATLTGSY